MKKNIISEHRNFGKALIALAKWLPAPEENPQMVEGNVICTAKQEYCENLGDIKKSRTTARLITLTEQKAWDILNIEKPNSTVVNIYERFVSSMPINKKERDYLLWFLRDEKSRKIAQDVFSKVNLLQWDENKWVINYFLKNDDWKFDFTRFLEFIIRDLEESRLIIPEGEDIKELVNWNDLVPEAKFFEYKVNSKTQICAVSDWKIYFLYNGNLKNIKLLDNWLIFWFDSEILKIWYLYHFNWNDFIVVNSFYWINNLEKIDSEELDNIYMEHNINWKKWLLEIYNQKEDKQPWNINELLTYEDDILVNDKFVTAVHLWERKDIYDTYVKKQNISTWFLGKIATTPIDKTNPSFEIKDVWNNLVSISTSELMSLLRFNKEESRLEVIDSALTKAKYFDITKLLNWVPTTITRENWNNWVYIFNKETWKLDILMFWAKSYKIIDNQIRSRIEDKYYIHYWKDWVLYKLKDWYKYHYNYWAWYIQKWFFWGHFYIDNSFEDIKEFLEPVDVSELPVDLK